MFDIFSENYKKNTKPFSVRTNSSFFKKKTSSSNKDIKTSFQNNLIEQIETESFNKDIDEFVKDLERIQDEMVQTPSLELIEKYRNSVGSFLEQILQNYQAIPFYRGIKNRVELKVWHLINSKMDFIAKEFIKGQLNGFLLLSHLNMVKGMVIDLKIGK